MSKADLQREIIANRGYIMSRGTLEIEHLLACAYDILVPRYNIRSAWTLANRVAKTIGFVGGTPSAVTASYHGYLKVRDIDKAHYLWHEDVYNYFNEIAPSGFYFGSSEGDASLIGWFRNQRK